MVLSKMYCSEQIVIPEKISNLLKTYAKGKKMLFSFSLLPSTMRKVHAGNSLKQIMQISIEQSFFANIFILE